MLVMTPPESTALAVALLPVPVIATVGALVYPLPPLTTAIEATLVVDAVVPVALMKLGSVSVMTTPVARPLPAFTTSTVYVKLCPGTQLLPLARLEMRTSGRATVVVADAVTFGVCVDESVAVFVTDVPVTPVVVCT